jgi:hypothetical protein
LIYLDLIKKRLNLKWKLNFSNKIKKEVGKR